MAIRPKVLPHFYSSSSGELFYLHVRAHADSGKALLVIPPFAEEMNKSRKMMALLLNRAAEQGREGFLFDLFGTGDSEGEFADAGWQKWLDNLGDMLVRLKQTYQVTDIAVVAIRTGALLLNDYLNQLNDADDIGITSIHYWNPVFNSSQFVSQFLRLKLAADMMQEGAEKLTAKQLRAQLAEQGQLEVAGYTLNESLIAGLEQANIALPPSLQQTDTGFYELNALGKLTPGLQKYIPTVMGEGDYLSWAHNAPQFWSTQEISLCEALLQQTLDNIQQRDRQQL